MSNITKERMHVINKQKIDLSDLKCEGKILDIGGGGEGIIGRLFKNSVVAIDSMRSELEETDEGPLKIVMDAGDMGFLDSSFDYVTSFFTMMYVQRKDRKKVLEELHRVLKSQGKLLIWDVTIPKPFNDKKDVYVIPIEVDLKTETVNTGYGIKWDGAEQNIQYYINLCKEIGFKIINIAEKDLIFSLILEKLEQPNIEK